MDYDPYINEIDYYPNGFNEGKMFYHVIGYIHYNHKLCIGSTDYMTLYAGTGGTMDYNTTARVSGGYTGYNRKYGIV
mgnify:CR=1 FL=1